MARKTGTIRATKSYEGLGYCIYCKAESEKLGKEHVVPLSMAGNLVLLGASCKECEKITSKIERAITKDFFGDFRNAMNYPTRRPSKRPETISGQRANDDQLIDIPWDHFPAILSLPVFEEPGVMAGRQPVAPMKFRMWNAEIHDNREPNITVEASFRVDDWLKYIAKICHAAAYCFLGPNCESYQQFLPSVIQGSNHQMYYVGGIWDETPEVKAETSTDLSGTIRFQKQYSSDGREALLVLYKPISIAGSPTYIGVFGQKMIGYLPMEPLQLRDPI